MKKETPREGCWFNDTQPVKSRLGCCAWDAECGGCVALISSLKWSLALSKDSLGGLF